jgi:hypothetical protein
LVVEELIKNIIDILAILALLHLVLGACETIVDDLMDLAQRIERRAD